MIEIVKKHKTVLLRTLGALLLIVGFAVNFWTTPKKGLTKSEIAAANVARMEASVQGSSASKKAKEAAKPDTSPFLKHYQSTRSKQIKYITILAMIVGVLFLLYSFFKKEEE